MHQGSGGGPQRRQSRPRRLWGVPALADTALRLTRAALRRPPLQLLAALVRLVLASDAMQAEINQRVEALAAARPAKDGGPGDEDSDGEAWAPPPAALQPPAAAAAAVAASARSTPAVSGDGGGGRTGSAPPAASAQGSEPAAPLASQGLALGAPPPAPVTTSDWADWLQQRRLGLRRPLGCDLRGRRYW